MGYQNDALELFLTGSKSEAIELTNKLNKYNIERQTIEREIFNQAIKTIENTNISKENSIVLWGKDWHQGVIRYCCI